MKILELFEAKIPASFRKQVAARVLAAQRSDGKIKWQDIEDKRSNAQDDDVDMFDAVYSALYTWAYQAEVAYKKFKAEITRIEEEQSEKLKTNVYLFDENIDEQNTLVDHRTRDSVDFWTAMLRTSEFEVGNRAEEYSIDINKLLGRNIY